MFALEFKGEYESKGAFLLFGASTVLPGACGGSSSEKAEAVRSPFSWDAKAAFDFQEFHF